MIGLLDWWLLALGGVAMGFINALAGGGGLIGLAVLQAAAGLAPPSLNASLRPAAVAIGAFAMLGFRSRSEPVPGRAWLYALAAMPGAVLGTQMALELPPLAYRLTLAAVVVVVAYQQLRPGRPKARDEASHPLLACGLFSLAGLHMGFVQVAVGLVVIAALTRVHSRDLVAINAAKTAIIIVAGSVSTIHFSLAGSIAWGPALALAGGAAFGSFLASRFAAARGHAAIRAFVLAICAATILKLAVEVLVED